MITVRETTNWSTSVPNHTYILSNDKRLAFGYIREGQKYPDLFTKPLKFDVRGRTFQLLVKTSG